MTKVIKIKLAKSESCQNFSKQAGNGPIRCPAQVLKKSFLNMQRENCENFIKFTSVPNVMTSVEFKIFMVRFCFRNNLKICEKCANFNWCYITESATLRFPTNAILICAGGRTFITGQNQGERLKLTWGLIRWRCRWSRHLGRTSLLTFKQYNNDQDEQKRSNDVTNLGPKRVSNLDVTVTVKISFFKSRSIK